MLVIAKFGGTSVANADSFKHVAKIVRNNIKIRVVVLSAVAGITNKLIKIFKLPSNKRKNACHDIIKVHENIIKQLELNKHVTIKLLKPIIDELLSLSESATTVSDLDQLLSIGERLSSVIMTGLLKRNDIKAIFFDARELIITNNNFGYATPKIEDIKLNCLSKITSKLEEYIIITQGFIGATKEGLSTTLGRGGSDYSAALFAEALNADLLEIYTDVKGIYTGDPNLIPNAKLIPNLSYNDIGEFSKFGARVLHPSTIIPCARMNIPILVKCTFSPNEGGTLINNKQQLISEHSIKAIGLLKNQLLFTINRSNSTFLNRIYEVLKIYQVTDTVVIRDNKNINIVINKDNFNTYNSVTSIQQKLFEEIQFITKISIEEDLSLLTLVGRNLSQILGTLQTIVKSVNFPIRMLCHETSFSSISLLIQNDYAHILFEQIHKIFLENEIA